MTENDKPTEGFARGSVYTYTAGFVLSLALTLTAFYLVGRHSAQQPLLSHGFLVGALIGLAVIQLFVQLIFFLHLDRESSPFWNLQLAIFAAGSVFIIVIGSIWIMNSLNYHMTDPRQTDVRIINDEGLRPH
jgi:cytochrome o ubiquinol oxidase operon protein cyoD